MTLWIYDWGIGGLSVVQELLAREPSLDFTYLSDAGYPPYGKVPRAELAKRVEQCLAYAASQGASHVVIACNAACSVLSAVTVPTGLALTDILVHSWEWVTSGPHEMIGIVGSDATIHYLETLPDPDGKTIIRRSAQPLSALIEAGDMTSVTFQETVHAIFQQLDSCDAIVLACTHYPAALPALQALLPRVVFLDPAKRVHLSLRPGQNRRTWQTTGAPQTLRTSAQVAFRHAIEEIEQICPG
jgi:glutamate racemase